MPIYSTLTPRSINQDPLLFKVSPVSYISTTTPKPFLSVKTQITSTTILSLQVSIFVRPQLAYHHLLAVPSHWSSTGTAHLIPIAVSLDLLFVTVVFSSLSLAPHLPPFRLPIQPLILSIWLPFSGCGSLDHGLSFNIFLLFGQEFLKLLTCNKKFILCVPCWLSVWFFWCSVYVFFYLCSWFLSFAFQVFLLVMLWIWFCWLALSRPVFSIEMEEEKGIVLLGRNRCYPLDLWFSGRFEKSCFNLKWRLDYWFVVWSRIVLPEDLALCCFYPGHLMARDPEVLVSKASPCVTRVPLFGFPMYQSLFMMSQFTGGVVYSSFMYFIGYFVLRVFTRFYV